MKIRRTSYHIQGKPNSKAEAIVKRKNIDEKEKQIQVAVNWCKENGKKDMLFSKLVISHSLKIEEPQIAG